MAEAVTLALEPAFAADAAWEGAGASLAPLAQCARWTLRLAPAAAAELRAVAGFPVAMDLNRCAAAGERLALRLGPDEWLLCAPEAGAEALARTIEDALAGRMHALVDVGHRYAALRCAGPQVTRLLAAGCPLDLHAAAFPPGTATRTLLGKAEVVLARVGEESTYRIECGRTFAPYVTAFLREAGREFA